MISTRGKVPWLVAGGAAAGVLLVGIFMLKLTDPPVAVRLNVLVGQTARRSGLMMAARRGDMIEPYEFTEYAVAKPFTNLRRSLDDELLAKGFVATVTTARFAAWVKDDLEVCLCGDQDSSLGAKDHIVANRSTVLIWRAVDDGWLTQVRISLKGT